MNVASVVRASEDNKLVQAGLKGGKCMLGKITGVTLTQIPKAELRSMSPIRGNPDQRGEHFMLCRLDRLTLPRDQGEETQP